MAWYSRRHIGHELWSAHQRWMQPSWKTWQQANHIGGRVIPNRSVQMPQISSRDSFEHPAGWLGLQGTLLQSLIGVFANPSLRTRRPNFSPRDNGRFMSQSLTISTCKKNHEACFPVFPATPRPLHLRRHRLLALLPPLRPRTFPILPWQVWEHEGPTDCPPVRRASSGQPPCCL